jgi:hypothetical protein
MPSFSATERAPAGIRPVATSTSHPSAAAVTASTGAATSSAASRNAVAADGGFAPVTTERTDGPSGTSGTPARASSSTNSSSGGAHTRTSAPSSRNAHRESRQRFDVPARSPRRQQHTHSRLPFPQVIPSGRTFCGTTGALPQAPRCAIR